MSNSRPDIYRVYTIAEVEARASPGCFQGSTDAPILGTQTGTLGTPLERTPGTRACGHLGWAESSDYVRFALFDSTTFPTRSGPLQSPRGHSLKSMHLILLY